MITVIAIFYLGCVFLAFKVIKLKVSPFSVAVATLIGVFLLTGIVIGWKFSAPISEQITVTRPVIPLVASQNTKEVIKKIHAKQDQHVKKGDILYEVETTPFQYAVDKSTAQVESAKENIRVLEAAVVVADSKINQAKAQLSNEAAQLKTAKGIQKDDKGAVSALKVKESELSYAAAKASVDVATALRLSTEHKLASARNALAATEAQLATAKLELERTITRAPADGFIMNWQATEGTMTTTVITSAQGTFQDMTRTRVVAVFSQNLLKNVAAGDTVEAAFKSFPHYIVTGKVEAVLGYTGEGQFQTTGKLPVAASVGSKGRLAVRITLDDESFARELPLGAAGVIAIYTQVGNPFHVITKIVMRMKNWFNYLPV
jgi:multidrug resistance efflux pump